MKPEICQTSKFNKFINQRPWINVIAFSPSRKLLHRGLLTATSAKCRLVVMFVTDRQTDKRTLSPSLEALFPLCCAEA